MELEGSWQHTTARYLEEAGGAQGVQSIHGVNVQVDTSVGKDPVGPGSLVGIRLVNDVHNQPILHHTSVVP